MEREETESLDASTANRNYLNRSLAIRVIKNDAYNVLSVLRSYVNNISGYSATSNLVPILGADATVLKTNEQKLIKKFKKLASAEEDESKHLEMEHLEPFFEVFKTFDNRHIKLLIMCVDALTNMAKSDLLCFEEEEAYESMNKMFGEVLNCFSSASELKEDFLLFKAFDCIGSIYRSHYGNMVNNENTCSMLKRFMTLMSNRNKNSFYKKVMYTKMNEVLLSAFGNERRYERYETDFYRRVNSIFLYVSLMTGLTNQFNYLGYHMEDTYLYIGDRDTMMSLRAHLTPILNGLTSTPTYFNEFTEEMKRMGLGVMLNALEWNLVNLSNANMVPIMQAHLTHSMYKLIFTDSITMYSLVLRSLRNLFNNFRYNLKAQMELFISHLISSVTAHVMEPKRTRADIVEMNMEFLGEFARNADMLVELYLNYDCDLKCTNVYGALVKCLLGCISNCEGDYSTSKSDQAKAKKTTPMKTTTKKTTQQYKATSGAGEAMPQINTEYFALGVIQSIIKYMLTDHKLYINTNPNGCITAQQTHTEYDKLKERAYKDKLVECSIEFNEAKSNKWMERGREMGVFSKNYTEKEVAVFLKNAPELDMNKVGEYLATHKNQEFMDKVRRTFCELNHFAGMPIVMAIRLFLSSFRLPGESQQIERLIEIFSKVYFTAQPLVEQTKESGRRGSMVEGEQAEEETDELKMARWVIQEEFYHKYKAIQQNCKQTALTSVSLNNMRGSSEHWVGDEPDHSELREASSWTSNTEMYDYFLANDTEGLVSAENYRKICEYLKNTPVTLETQTTYNDSIPASNAEAEGANREESTQRSGGTESSRNTVEHALVSKSNSASAQQSIGSIWTESQVNDQGPTSTKVKIENKNGFAYIQDYNAIFVLCYSIIMLNTDLHNNQIKNKMKLEDFIRNNRGTNDGKNFSTEFLKDIYNTIKYHEIKLHSTHSPNNSKYEPYLWSDYVLQRQNKLSQYVQLTRHEEKGDEETRKKRAAQRLVLGSTDGSAHLKLKLLEELLESRLLEVLDNLFSNCRTIEMLKKIVELLWLLVRVALKHGNHELMNEVFQLTSVDVSYGLGYKCQISISFALNVMALASEHFDTKSWAKALDIVTRLYCLNLLPATFGALDGDGRLFSSYWSDLTVPSIRFKRLTDRRTSNWLVGLSNLMPFTKVGYGTEGAKGGKKEADGECDETFLFLFDVQMSTKDLLQNKFFDVYLLRNKFSPIYSSEDEATINNVTKTLSSESDREELLPPILTYINLRLAFLNIYKLDDLFMGTITNAELKSFKQFLAVITRNIFKVLVPFQESPRDRDSFRERDSFGNILDPNVMELDRFRAKISAIFNLGIFSRLALHVLTTGTSGTSGTASGTTSGTTNRTTSGTTSGTTNGTTSGATSGTTSREEKRRQLLRCFVEVFYNLSRKLVVKSALEHLPSKEEIYARFGLKDAMAGPEYVRSEYEHEGMEEPLSNYVAFILLNLVLWFVDYFNDHKDMESPTSRSRHAERPGAASGKSGASHRRERTFNKDEASSFNVNGSVGTSPGDGPYPDPDGNQNSNPDGNLNLNPHSNLDANQNANSNTDPTGNQNCKLDGTLMDLSTWLLHLFINFENKTFNAYLDPMEKLLYNLADSACIAKNKYIVTIMMCAIQRMVNPYLPFGTEQFRKETSKTSGSILTLLLRRSKCLSWNDEYVARLTAQTLLSIGLYSNKTMVPEKEGTASNQRKHGSAPGQDQKNVKEKYAENLLAIQLLIEFNSFAGDENKENLERLWLLSLHSLSILFSIGPREISNEAIKGLNKLLLQQKYPETRCSFTSQVSRIFDHVLAPMLTHNFSYPLPPETEKPLREKRRDRSSANNNYRLANPFQTPEHTNEGGEQWMTRFLSEYINNYAFSDYNDLATRKAAATNLVCHALLSKLNELMTDHQEEALKASGSSLECLLYDHKEVCEHNCVKRLLVFTQYVLNVIIPSNGEIHTGISRDTYLEALKNFILVLLTSPELKMAPESCKNHFKNDAELKACLEAVKEQVDFGKVTPGEYVLSSLLAHTFSSSDSLKSLFFDVLKVVFPNLEPEPAEPPPPHTATS